MLRIWGRTNSINVQKCSWCCHELALDYVRIDAGLHFGVTQTPEYSAMNPNRLVPTIEDGEMRSWESNVIVRYLAHTNTVLEAVALPILRRGLMPSDGWIGRQPRFSAGIAHRSIALIRTTPAERDASVVSKAEALCGYWIIGSRTVPSSQVMPSRWVI